MRLGRGTWQVSLLVAAVALVIVLDVYLIRRGRSDSRGALSRDADPALCVECHRDIVNAWSKSHHAIAQRGLRAEWDLPRFAVDSISAPGETYRVVREDGEVGIQLIDAREGRPVLKATKAFGHTPLVQYLFDTGGGRLQAWHMAWDVKSNEWFSVFEDEERRPHEWGYWENRGMNWNSQCAWCHLTTFRKNYDLEEDTYASSWAAEGVTCLQCHGDLAGHSVHTNAMNPPREVSMETCAPCHSVREHLREDFKPGDEFNDHFRVTLMDQPGVYHPDGQVIQENYNYGSLLSSKMGQKGVTCMDCHDPHSGSLKYPVENNVLCLSCHAEPVKNGAIPIHPVEHGHHKPDSVGNRCIECHMPKTTFMARDPRRDHAFTSPDPILTKEMGVPNACSTCHADKSIEWNIEHFEKWYPKAADRRARERARVIRRAWQGNRDDGSGLLEMARTESNDFWRASLVQILRPWSAMSETFSFLSAEIGHSNELVRMSAVQALSGLQAAEVLIRPRLSDNSRMVRVQAAMALAGSLSQDSEAHRDAVEFLRYSADQPVGAMRLGEWLAASGKLDEGLIYVDRALAWDPVPGAFAHAKAMMLHQGGRPEDALNTFKDAILREPENPDFYYSASLLLAEVGRMGEAIPLLEKCTALDSGFFRAWYNLGLAYAQEERLEEAAGALKKACEVEPTNAEAPYALATIHLRQKDPGSALRILQQILAVNPGYQPARNLLNNLGLSSGAMP